MTSLRNRGQSNHFTRHLAVRTGLNLGLVAAASAALPGQAAGLSTLGHPLVPGRDGLAAVVATHEHLQSGGYL